MNRQIILLPGDGIGKEIMESAKVVLNTIASEFGHRFIFHEHAIGGDAIDRFETPLPEDTIKACQNADAILLGAVGGSKWDSLPPPIWPEKGILGIRSTIAWFAKLRLIIGLEPYLYASQF